MNGTVVLLDSNKERGEEFAKYLVTMVKDNRAYFHECELEKIESVKSAIETITKSLDITILLNCSTDHLVSTYFNVKTLFCSSKIKQIYSLADLSRTFSYHEREQR